MRFQNEFYRVLRLGRFYHQLQAGGRCKNQNWADEAAVSA